MLRDWTRHALHVHLSSTAVGRNRRAGSTPAPHVYAVKLVVLRTVACARAAPALRRRPRLALR
jgi:hypothetical protein